MSLQLDHADNRRLERRRKGLPPIEWEILKDEFSDIERLKRERDAIVLAHNYQIPAIYHGVADIVGDSLALAREAMNARASVIVMAGVHFMAETAKLLNPSRTVLIPDIEAGCSLATSVTPEDVRLLRASYPGVPIAAYVNTSAAVKAESDICFTSANARRIVESLGSSRVIMLPDEYLAQNLARETDVDIIAWHGHCEVHQRFTAEDIRSYRSDKPGLVVLAHPECPPDVCAEADFVGSTAQMTEYLTCQRPARAVLVTECSMADNVASDHPDTEFLKPCNLCPHMRRITLGGIRQALERLEHRVEIPAEVATRATRAIRRMLAVS